MKYLIAIFCLSMVACAKPDVVCQDFITGDGATRLVTFGDSQTAGHATENSIMCGHSWANMIAVKHNYSLTNQAVAGTNFVSADEFDALMDFDWHPSDRVMGLISYNDMSNFGMDPTHLGQYKAALKMALQTVAPRVTSITLGTCLVPHVYRAHQSPAAVDLYRQATKDVVAELNLPNVYVVDAVDDDFATDDSYFVADQVHLSLKAQAVIADRMDVH